MHELCVECVLARLSWRRREAACRVRCEGVDCAYVVRGWESASATALAHSKSNMGHFGHSADDRTFIHLYLPQVVSIADDLKCCTLT